MKLNGDQGLAAFGRILAQLAHYGAAIHAAEPGQPLWSPSDVGSELVRETPHAMTTAEIDEVVRAFGAAAGRVRQGGLDGVEILGAFGLLLGRLINPLVMGLLFYLVVTPTGLIMRALGKDLLRLKRDPDATSYWIERTPPGPSGGGMPRQF